MGARLLTASLAVLVIVITLGEETNGLDCPVCLIGKRRKPNCEMMPCNSMDDYKKAMQAQYKQKSRGKGPPIEIDLDPNDERSKTTEFLCIRILASNRKGRRPHIASGCSPRLANFPARDEPYPLKDYSIGEKEASHPDKEELVAITRAVTKIRGDVYIRGEKVGNGPNCGEKASTDIKSVPAKFVSDKSP